MYIYTCPNCVWLGWNQVGEYGKGDLQLPLPPPSPKLNQAHPLVIIDSHNHSSRQGCSQQLRRWQLQWLGPGLVPDPATAATCDAVTCSPAGCGPAGMQACAWRCIMMHVYVYIYGHVYFAPLPRYWEHF